MVIKLRANGAMRVALRLLDATGAMRRAARSVEVLALGTAVIVKQYR